MRTLFKKILDWFQWDEWRGSGDKPVLLTKHLFTLKGWRWNIHKFVGADEDNRYHSHPAVAYRFVLWGWYKEVIVEPDENGAWTVLDIVTWKKFNFGKVTPDLVHNIYECKVPTYTLWIRGPKTHKIKKIGKGWGEDEDR